MPAGADVMAAVGAGGVTVTVTVGAGAASAVTVTVGAGAGAEHPASRTMTVAARRDPPSLFTRKERTCFGPPKYDEKSPRRHLEMRDAGGVGDR
ncbi:hypothetical protein CH252_19235 [Rhodococcus sp. 06-1477-1B]|nr:hypothetical protein CH252_19235 [Rhodococcus sp. 06-1477-1B]